MKNSRERVGRAYRIAQGALLVWAFAVSAAAWSQSWQPNETLVSATPDLVDLEYSQSRAMYVRVDANGALWLGHIDRNTGDFLQADGKEILADTLAQTIGDGRLTFTGPEWVVTANGDQVIYTRFPAGGSHTAKTARLGIATPDADGIWHGTSLGPDLPRYAPFGSKTKGDTRPLITYVDNAKNKLWRDPGDPASEAMVPGTAPGELNAVTIVKGAHALVYRRQVDNVWQAFRYDIDTQALEQLTFDTGNKQTVWMWMAPEYDDFVLLALVDQVEVRAYRRQSVGADGALQWVPFYSAKAPDGSTISSLEAFTYNGRSYTFMEMTSSPNRWPSNIWVSNVDPKRPLFRRITDDSVPRARTDPEVFVTKNGPIIYYNRYDPAVNPKRWYCAECSEGVYRADPGLTTP